MTDYVFNEGTPEGVKAVINEYVHNGRRIRIFLGDPANGKDWGEEFETMGYIGKSTGWKPIPLLISNSRSLGGPALLTDNILKIVDIATREVLYQHPAYKPPEMKIIPGSDCQEVYKNGELYARCITMAKAENLVGFLRGERMAK
jgi:hypothetical protein